MRATPRKLGNFQCVSTILIANNNRDHAFFDAYRLNVKTGEIKMDVASINNTYAWLSDHAGVIRVIQNANGVTMYRPSADKPFEQIFRTGLSLSSMAGGATSSAPDWFIPRGITADDHLLVESNVGRDKLALVEFDPVARKEVRQIYANPDVDTNGIEMSQLRHVLACVYADTDKFERACPDEAANALYQKLQTRLPGYWVNLVSSNRAETRFIVQARSDRQSGKYYLYDAATDKLQPLGERRPWLQEKDLATVHPASYPSRDGLTIHGYLTLPPGHENAKGLPLIVNPHGGPRYRDYWGYVGEAQFLASRGWAVFQMNYRGSTGYGKKFLEAGTKEWGGKMQDDITDGVEWLKKTGVADPERICIFGTSYGGYATLSGITKTPDLYHCAVDYAGIANLFTFLDTIPPYWNKWFWYALVGNPKTDYFMLKNRSPINHVDDIKTPLLVIHGAKDPRVNINEAKQIVDALKKRNVDVEFMVKDNEGHGFHNEENQMDAYKAMETFFRRYLDQGVAPIPRQ